MERRDFFGVVAAPLYRNVGAPATPTADDQWQRGDGLTIEIDGHCIPPLEYRLVFHEIKPVGKWKRQQLAAIHAIGTDGKNYWYENQKWDCLEGK